MSKSDKRPVFGRALNDTPTERPPRSVIGASDESVGFASDLPNTEHRPSHKSDDNGPITADTTLHNAPAAQRALQRP